MAGRDSTMPNAESTFQLLARARAGDRSALDTLFARYLPPLRRWASGRLPRSIDDSLHEAGVILIGAGFNREAPLDDVGVGLGVEPDVEMGTRGFTESRTVRPPTSACTVHRLLTGRPFAVSDAGSIVRPWAVS